MNDPYKVRNDTKQITMKRTRQTIPDGGRENIGACGLTSSSVNETLTVQGNIH